MYNIDFLNFYTPLEHSGLFKKGIVSQFVFKSFAVC